MELEDFPQARLNYKDQYVLEMAAEIDQKSLKEELQEWYQEQLCNAEDCGSSTHDPNGDSLFFPSCNPDTTYRDGSPLKICLPGTKIHLNRRSSNPKIVEIQQEVSTAR